ncbi:dihydroxyacetone kinase subunit DhaL [Halanaerobaculum tunisiense]
MTDKLVDLFIKVADEIIANKEYLTKLDSDIGDGDHGINMARGFSAVKEELANSEFNDQSQVLKKISMTLISNVGGASGPLYGTAFLKASQVIDDLSLTNLIEVGEAVVTGIQKRGKAELEDKTMLDTIIPIVDYLKENQEAGNNLEEALGGVVEVAEEGMKSTIPLVAKKGRASYLGDRSKGHQDPGATSSFLIIKTIVEELED